MKLSQTRFVVLDTETTGLNPDVDRVVDVALVELLDGRIDTIYESLVHPERVIPPDASAVHHITYKHVKDAPPWTKVQGHVEWGTEGAIVAAHNAKFDSGFVRLPNPWLCTYRLAKHLWPELAHHSNQYLRYYFGLDVEDVSVHRAQGDAFVTAHVLRFEIAEYLRSGAPDDAEALLAFAESPITVHTMPFGKHRGVPLQDVPKSYLEWALGNLTDLDDDLKWSMETVLGAKVGA